jgi:nucleotide-binding universal stress UspA family protein
MAGNEEAILTLASRTHDVLVLGQGDPNVGKSWPKSHNLLEGVLLKSGHPLIAVPYLGSFPSVGDRVMVAWNGAREAARALEDALPILEKAEQVTVLTVDLRSGDALSVDSLVRLLERHGVSVSTEGARSYGRSIGETLLENAQRLGCELLVMGGYGHSPIREHLIGGPTYYALEHMNVPILLLTRNLQRGCRSGSIFAWIW